MVSLTSFLYFLGNNSIGSICFIKAFLFKQLHGRLKIFSTFKFIQPIDGIDTKITIHDTDGQGDYSDIRKNTYKSCDPNKTIVLYCYSATMISSLENIKTFWFPEVNSCSGNFTQVLIRFKKLTGYSKLDFVPMKKGDKMMKDLGLSGHFSFDSLTYCNTNGKKGNVAKVFSNSIKTHFKRKLPVKPDDSCSCESEIKTEKTDQREKYEEVLKIQLRV